MKIVYLSEVHKLINYLVNIIIDILNIFLLEINKLNYHAMYIFN